MSEETQATAQVSAIDDTQTKKTIRLRPVLAKAAPVINPESAAVKPAAPVAPAADSSEDTRTRKTIKLKPLMPKVASTNRTVDPLAIPAPSAKPLDGGETKTRRTIPLAAVKPAVAPAPTIAIETPKAPEAGNSDDDRTVKVKRPAIVKPVEAPRPALKFNRPAATPAAPGFKPAPAIVPNAAIPPVEPAKVAVAADTDDYDEEDPGKFQVALSVVAALALLASSALLALNYFNIAL